MTDEKIKEGIFESLKMPGLAQRNAQFSIDSSSLYSSSCSGRSASANGIWSKHRDDVTFDQLQKFWSALSPQARQELLRIDKQTLFEQARKNLYCSRCNGLLLEGFSQIIIYGKSLQQDGAAGHLPNSRPRASKNQNGTGLNIMTLSCHDDTQDPSVHPWGGLAATRDGILTLLDCFLDAKSLKALQNVFDSARARERERELLYPDACGGGGRGWISQGMLSYGRGHGTRETCALHTARLSCDTLVDFWSALGDETRQSLLRMKEEDFIERLMHSRLLKAALWSLNSEPMKPWVKMYGYRATDTLVDSVMWPLLFDSKRFCRDCRRNVIREFKELKELKRMRREPRCTSWFCVADTAFQYEEFYMADRIPGCSDYRQVEFWFCNLKHVLGILTKTQFRDLNLLYYIQVSDDTVRADWHQSFTDTVGTYHHFEWAIGTGEGKSDILEFEDVGMNGSVQVNGLDLGGLSACFITLRAWKLDGRCTELSVKAHALKGQQCVHRRLVVGDGYATITKGESIIRFFEHAEEAEEEEDDDSMDKDGNELDGEGSRPQKHAKSPELAREFLLDAATVEKAFREGTARQNAHSIFVCLALKLLEERVHVACKEIITLEKQKIPVLEISTEESSPSVQEDPMNTIRSGDSVGETGNIMLVRPLSPDMQDEQFSNWCITSKMRTLKSDSVQNSCNIIPDWELGTRDGNGSFSIEASKSYRRKLRFMKEVQLNPASKWCDRRRSTVGNNSGVVVDESEPRLHGGYVATPSRHINGVNRQSRNNALKSNTRNCGPKFGEKFHCSNYRMQDRHDLHSCSCNQHSNNRGKDGPHVSVIRSGREIKMLNKSEYVSDVSRPFYHNSKCNYVSYIPDSCGIPKSKLITGNNPQGRDLLHAKKVWEPMESRKKYPRSNSESDVPLRSSTFKVDDGEEVRCNGDENCSQQPNNLKSSGDLCSNELSESSGKISGLNCQNREDNNVKESRNSTLSMDKSCQNGFGLGANAHYYSKDVDNEEVELCPIISPLPMNSTSDPVMSSGSSSDNCSWLSEGDSSTASSSTHNVEFLSTSDSKDASPQSEERETSVFVQNGFHKCHDIGLDDKHEKNEGESTRSRTSAGFPLSNCAGSDFPGDPPMGNAHNPNNGRIPVNMSSQQHHMLPPMHNQSMHFPVFPAHSTMGYYHQDTASWSAGHANGLMPFPQPNRYLFTSPAGYGLSANRPSHFCMQYGALQPLATHVLNVGQLPVYQPVNKANGGGKSKEQTESSKLGAAQEALNGADALGSECHLEKPVQNGKAPPEAPSHGGRTGISTKLHNENTNFSLFHFGGPVAVPSGCNLNQMSLKERIVGDFSLSSPAEPVEDDLACEKKEIAVEEYSLFAASNGTRFSFF
ncbi:hypothetical protein HHK36_017461 [Tetracentron sinense]|uniref:Uncharacterized protein n=1 Tax=Tetracentron sinense TaxID=13715 RepID=A0A834Z4D8_TETSI|nr:hypothetical protein HHK36_017461 [Tetracentron sinense]